MSLTTIRLWDRTDRWRFVCPRGHSSWDPTNEHYWCASCSNMHDDEIDPSFDELTDQKTGETLGREEVRLLTEAGPYRDVATEAGV